MLLIQNAMHVVFTTFAPQAWVTVAVQFMGRAIMTTVGVNFVSDRPPSRGSTHQRFCSAMIQLGIVTVSSDDTVAAWVALVWARVSDP